MRLKNAIRSVTNVLKWIAIIDLTIMMLIITFVVILRALSIPIVGDYELTEFSMVIVIACSLAYTESVNEHIAIGIIIDKAPQIVQKSINVIGSTLTIIFCFVVSYVFIVTLNYDRVTDLLDIPLYPFKILIALGFFLWGLEALLTLISQFITGEKEDEYVQ